MHNWLKGDGRHCTEDDTWRMKEVEGATMLFSPGQCSTPCDGPRSVVTSGCSPFRAAGKETKCRRRAMH